MEKEKERRNQWENLNTSQKCARVFKWTGIGIGGIAVVVCGGATALGACGFATTGIVGGSIAAGI